VGRRRESNKHLPQRVYLHHGRYWFMERDGRRRDLGTTEAEMYSKLAELVETRKPLYTMNQVFDRYLNEALTNLSPRTQSDYRGYIENLRKSFGEAPPKEISANSIFDYRAARAKQSVVQANREVSCLSAIFREAIGWHAIERNPCHELKRLHEQKRTRYVTDQEYLALYNIASERIQCLMDVATITGQREVDLLKLPNRDPSVYTDEGMVFRPGKSKRRHPRHGKIIETAKTVIVEWSAEFEAVIKRLRKVGPDMRRTLFCNLDGKPYTESGFRSNWARLMNTALKGRKRKNGIVTLAPVLAAPFTFHDLRAKSGSDADDLQEANDRLAHDDLRTTQVVYRRKPRRARPGRKVGA
jgi:integrase